MAQLIQCIDELVEAQEVADQRKICAIASFLRTCKCTRHDVAQLVDVTHVKTTYSRIDRQCPPQAAILLHLRTVWSREVPIVGRRHDKGMPWKPSILHNRVNLRLPSELRNVEFAAADYFYVWKRRPDQVINACRFRGLNCRCCLLDLIGAVLPEVGDQKDAMGTFQGRNKSLRPFQICCDRFVSDAFVLGRVARKRTYFELAAFLQGTARTTPPP